MISPFDQSRSGKDTPAVAMCDQVVRIARDRLGQSGYGPLRDVHCDYAGGVLTLRGHVPTFYMKQVAQVAVKDLQHVRQVNNQLVVTPTR